MTKNFKLAVLASAIAVSFNANASLVLDSFDDAIAQQVFFSDITASVTYSSVATSSAIGGYRDLSITNIVPAAGTMFVDPRLAVQNGVLSWTNGTASSIATVRYDGGGAGNQYGLSLDLTALSSVVLNVKYSDANFPFKITLFSDAGNYTSLTLPANPIALPGGEQTIDLGLFDSIGVDTGTGANFANVTAIEYQLIATNMSGVPGTPDVILDKLSVPEPASLALVGLGLIGVGSLRRRTRK